MPHTTQWVHTPAGASGSSQTSANAFVPAGGAVHSSAGETSAPSQVCFFGMSPPEANAALFNSKPIAVPPRRASAVRTPTAPAQLRLRRNTEPTLERSCFAVQPGARPPRTAERLAAEVLPY